MNPSTKPQSSPSSKAPSNDPPTTNNDILYSKLPSYVLNEKTQYPLEPPKRDPASKDFTSSFVKSNISTEFDPTRVFSEKLEGKILEIDTRNEQKTTQQTTAGLSSNDNNTKQLNKKLRNKRRKVKTLTAKEKRALRIHELPRDNCKWEFFEPIHMLWKGYMREILNVGPLNKPLNPNALKSAVVLPKLLKADYHGCILTVTKSKCPTYIGASGICVKETENIFYLITRKNELKAVPKSNSIFSFCISSDSKEGDNISSGNDLHFEIYGNQFRMRAGERIAKKFKDRPSVDL